MLPFAADEAYVAELVSLSLRQLREEPKRLAALRLSINDRIQALSLENYSVHIDNHNCGNNVRQEVRARALPCALQHAALLQECVRCLVQLATLTSRVASVAPCTKDVASRLKVFEDRASAIRHAHQRIRMTLQHHSQVRRCGVRGRPRSEWRKMSVIVTVPT